MLAKHLNKDCKEPHINSGQVLLPNECWGQAYYKKSFG